MDDAIPPTPPETPETPPTTTEPPTSPAEAQWQERAAAAAQRITELESKAQELERLLAEARQSLDTSQRSREMEKQLMLAGAIDLDAARLLIEAQLGTSAACPSAADLHKAIGDLVRRKPFLFHPPAPRGGAMSSTAAPAETALEDAASAARQSGDRRALLRYLRLRRTTA